MKTVTTCYDYLCPFAQRGMVPAEQVAEPLDVMFDWQHFSLYRGNYKGEDGWKLWQDTVQTDDENGSKGLLPFLASRAARKLADPASGAADGFRLERTYKKTPETVNLRGLFCGGPWGT